MFNLKKDIEIALKRYPLLRLDGAEKFTTVVGSFTAFDRNSNIEIETYEIKVQFPERYPYRFPIVEELSRKIPRSIDRHIKTDGTICFANPQDEFGLCSHGITFIWFLNEIINTHLCREFVKEKTGNYPTGERSHGNDGIWEGYFDLFNTTEKVVVLKELDLMFTHLAIKRNDSCYCESGKKYKACHSKITSEVIKPGIDIVKELFELLKKDYKEKK